MKSFTFLPVLLFVFSTIAVSQSEFVIGAEWLNDPIRINGSPHVPSSQDWANMNELGLNWGMIGFNSTTPDSYAYDALTSAESNGMKLILERYRSLHDAAIGQRWQYHPEYSAHYPTSGSVGSGWQDDNATRFPDDKANTYSTWRVIAGQHPPGYIAVGLRSEEQPEGSNYIVKVRMRLEDGTPLAHTPVCIVTVVRDNDGASSAPDTIYADKFGLDYAYREVGALTFHSSESDPLSASTQKPHPAVPEQGLIGHRGIPPPPMRAAPYSLDYQIYWPGQVSCYLDYVIVDDESANLTFAGVYNTEMDQEVNLFKDRSGLGRFKIWDEVNWTQYGRALTVGYVERRIKSIVDPAGFPSKTGTHFNVGYYGGGNYIGRDIAWSENKQSMVDIYPIFGALLMPDENNYTTDFQDHIQSKLIEYLRMSIVYANYYQVPFWFTPQAHSVTVHLREPTTSELRQMVNLGLAYGAKGIHYFLYWTYDSGSEVMNGLVEKDGTLRREIYPGTSYAGDKWATVKSINQKLTTLGSTLLALTWQEAFSIHQGQPTGTFITSISTGDANPYVELGLFKDASNTDYFMLVNRRTIDTESRNIATVFSLPAGSWEISDVGSGNAWIIQNTGSFSDSLAPGEAKLYKVVSAVYSTTRTIPSGSTLTVSGGTSAIFQSGASLVVNGQLVTQGSQGNEILFTAPISGGTWDGVFINGSGANGSRMEYVTVEKVSTDWAGAAVSIYGATGVTVEHCNISNSTGYTNGLWFTNAGSPDVGFNNINSNSGRGVGFTNTNGYFYGNNVDGNSGGGVYCYNYASPSFGKIGFPAYNGNNRISGGAIGLEAELYSSPYVGSQQSSEFGYNWIGPNSSARVYAFNNCTILAEENYWDTAIPDSNMFQTGNNSTIEWNPYLEAPPGGERGQTVKMEAISVQNGKVKLETPELDSTDVTRSILEASAHGKLHTQKNAIVEALSGSIAENDKSIVYGAVLSLYRERSDKDLLLAADSRASKISVADPALDLLRAKMRSHIGDTEGASKIYQEISNRNPDSEFALAAMLDDFYLSALAPTQDDHAISLLTMMTTKHADHPAVAAARFYRFYSRIKPQR